MNGMHARIGLGFCLGTAGRRVATGHHWPLGLVPGSLFFF